MSKVSICLVGVGSIGRRHLRLLKERDDAAVSVVEPSDASWARAAAGCGPTDRYASLEEALEKARPDAVAIAAPHGAHAPLAIQALEAGTHVFCEKPMSDSLPQCVRMLRAAERSGKVFSVGFMFHFDPFIRTIKRLLDEGRIGRPVHYSSRFATYNTLKCSVTRHQRHTPYSLVMDCIHDTDLLCWLTGRVPDFAYANAIQAGDLALTSAPNAIDTVYRWADGGFAAFTHFNYIEHPQVHTLEIAGDKGYIIGDFMKPSITVGSLEDGTVETIGFDDYRFDDVYRAEWSHFLAAVRGEVEPENPARSAILPTLLMQAQIDSASQGREVDIRLIAREAGL